MSSSIVSSFRIALMALVLAQIFPYGILVVYSMFLGPVDLVIPLDFLYFYMVFFLLYLGYREVSRAAQNLSDRSNLQLSLVHLAGESISSAVLTYSGLSLLVQPLPLVSLMDVGLDVRLFATFGVVLIFLFGILAIWDLFASRRKPLPNVTGANP